MESGGNSSTSMMGVAVSGESMFRRQAIFEKIKSTKLNKLTVKQGGVNVKLNLKRDLLDPNVEISDQVLSMLESYPIAPTLAPLPAATQVPAASASATLAESVASAEATLTGTTEESQFCPLQQHEVLSTMTSAAQSPQHSAAHSSLPHMTTTAARESEATPMLSTTTISSIRVANQAAKMGSPQKRVRFNEPIVTEKTYTEPTDETLPEAVASAAVFEESLQSVLEQVPRPQDEDDQPEAVRKAAATQPIHRQQDHSEQQRLEHTVDVTGEQTEAAPVSSLAPQPAVVYKELMCRLCRLQCSNERARYEHVARIHGGKGVLSTKALTTTTTTAGANGDEDWATEDSDDDFDDDEDDDDDDDDDDDQLPPSGNARALLNSQKRRRMRLFGRSANSKTAPGPSVAIRVAKVAYYNSKGLPSAHALASPLFKSKIFTNGGIRGNFFSQERLPLKSCKIKMKLNENSAESSSTSSSNNADKSRASAETANADNDVFLTNRLFLASMVPVSRNITVTTQSSNKNNNYNNNNKSNDAKTGCEDSVSANEIRQFFRSLLNYIPIKHVMRVDDLIKANEALLKQMTADVPLADVLRSMHARILEARQFGLSFAQLKRALQLPSRLLAKLVQLLVDNWLVLPVGVVERVYVAHEFKQHWVIHSYKNLKGRSCGPAADDYNGSEIPNESDNENDEQSQQSAENNDEYVANQQSTIDKKLPTANVTAASTAGPSTPSKQITAAAAGASIAFSEVSSLPTLGSGSGGAIAAAAAASAEVGIDGTLGANLSRQFKPVCLIPRPWRYIDGLLNRPALKKMLETILLYLKYNPNASLRTISAHYCPVLQPVMTLELLEMLERLRCVVRVSLRRATDCDLFSSFDNGASLVDDADELDGDEIAHFHCMANSIFIIKKLFA